MVTVLVTRPAPDAARTAETLRSRGYEALVSPLLELVALPVDVPKRRWQAAVFTSNNAALLAPIGAIDLETPCLAVGDATSDALRQRGFTAVASVRGDVEALYRAVLTRFSKGGGPIAYPGGVARTGALAERLVKQGYDVARITCYDMRFRNLSDDAKAALRDAKIDAVLLYSPRTAQAFDTALMSLPASVQARLNVFGLSRAVVEALPAGGRWHAHWSPEPNEVALLNLLDRHFAPH